MIEFRQTRPASTFEIEAIRAAIEERLDHIEVRTEALHLSASGFAEALLDEAGVLTLCWSCGSEGPIVDRGLRLRLELLKVTAEARNDRFASYPLCYAACTGEAIALSSRADRVPGHNGAPAPQAIFDYLYFHVIPSPETIHTGVRRLPPACRLQLAPGSAPRVERTWEPCFRPQREQDVSLSALKQEFLSRVEDAVRRTASHHCAAFLSGGTDSSTVVGMLCRLHGPVRCYSMGFEAHGYDEMAYARIAARHFGADHFEHYITAPDLTAHAAAVAAYYDQPFGNSSALPAYVLGRLARADGHQHLLAGDGGDELFGGNTRYARQRIFGLYAQVPSILRQQFIEPLLSTALARLPLVRKLASYVTQARTPLPDRNEGYNLLLRLGTGTLLTPSFLAQVSQEHPLEHQREVWHAADAVDDLNRLLAFDWRFTLADNDLPKVLGTAELAGLSVGFPFITDALVDFSLDLPLRYKLRGLDLRWFFKEALRGFLPEEILRKKKHGFGLPFGLWALTDTGLRQMTTDALGSFSTRGVVQKAFLKRLEHELLPRHPGYYGEMVWIILMLELWMQAHCPDWRLD